MTRGGSAHYSRAMSDASRPTPADETPVVVPASEAPAAEPVVAEPVVVKKKRGIGAWSFVLGLLTILGDVLFVVIAIATGVTVFAGLSGNVTTEGLQSAAGTAIGLVVYGGVVLFGGLLVAGIGALLGLIALISGRGRVLGFFGLLFSVIGLVVRILILTGAAGGIDRYTSMFGG